MTRGLTGCWGRQATQGGMAVGDEGRAAAEAGEHEWPRTRLGRKPGSPAALKRNPGLQN